MSLLSNSNTHGARRLRELLTSSDVIQAPGAYDCLSARLIEAAGFPIVYMTGFGTSASYLGRPDVGLLGMSEMVDNARRIADFRIVIFPISALLIATQAISKALETIKQDGTPVSLMAHMTPFREFVNSLGFAEISEVEKRFGQSSQ